MKVKGGKLLDLLLADAARQREQKQDKRRKKNQEKKPKSERDIQV